ncbi:MAG: hypothetical protein CVV27_07205 [Candidatus Melainabacteria bacterium HGW-Melainabacteria-1]|nr:MAG: hypothetical protein CVV27_07205 [Candidatus Melainabacteria bacterium HGW-Melainabacteria-1]
MARIASYTGNLGAQPPKPLATGPLAPSTPQVPAPGVAATNENIPAEAHNLTALKPLPGGAAESDFGFVDDIVNPWAAPGWDEIAGGEVIRRHLEGESVSQLQSRLNQLGYALESTGVMDAATEQAVQAFQLAHNIEPNGQFGPASLDALLAAEQTQAEEAERAAQKQAEHELAIETLKAMPSAELHRLSRKDPELFFKALLPAALESERQYGVPAVVTLAQGAMESEFARAPIGGYNIFGIKGGGPAGSVKVSTREVVKGKDVVIKANFARYNNYYEAVKQHGKLFQNGYYDKPMQQYAQDRDVMAFIDGFAKTYATEPKYAKTLKYVIEKYKLLELTAQAR